MTYELLTGCPPFYDSSRANTEARIKAGALALPAGLSEGARGFIGDGEDSRCCYSRGCVKGELLRRLATETIPFQAKL
jgi:hypothetical protein